LARLRIDIHPRDSYAEARAFLEAIGQQGRRYYVSPELVIDTVYPPLYAVSRGLDTGGRPANRLLSGDDIAEAKAWVARRPKGAPEPTPLHLDFIRASEQEADERLSEQR